MAAMQSDLLIPDTVRDPQPGDSLILFLPVFLSIGIGAYFALTFEPPAPVLWGALIAAVLGCVVTLKWRSTYAWRWIATLIVAVTFGLVLAQIRTHVMYTNLLSEKIWNAEVTGVVQSVEHAGAGWRVVLTHAHINGDAKDYTLRISVRQRGFMPQLGQSIAMKASLMPASPPFVPGAFDFQRHAYFQGISGYGYGFKVHAEQTQARQSESLLEDYRSWIADKVYAYLPKRTAGVTTALLNGQRAGIDRGITRELQQSGLQHIISISGVHVSLLAGIVFYCVRLLLALNMRLALTWPIKKIAACCALAAIVAYMLVVGLSPPTVRSVIMTGVVLSAILVDREAINLRVVAIAAVILLVWQPESVFDIGFQLSFAAVTGLVAFYQYTRDFWLRPFWQESLMMKILRILALSMVTTIVATAATAPLVLLHFQQIPMLSMLSNLLATPVVEFMVMPGTFLTYLFLPVPVIGEYSVRLMGLGVAWMLDISSFVAHLPSAVWRAPALPASTVLLMMAGLFLVIAVKTRLRWAGAVLCVLAALPLFFNPAPDLLLTHDRIVLLPDPDKDILYVEGKADAFQKNMLLQLTGKHQAQPFDCPSDVCDFDVAGKSVRLIRTVPALERACDTPKDIIVTRYYLDDRCKTGLVIDRHDVENKEGAALWVGRDIRVRYGRETAARRPWEQNTVKHQWYSKRKFVK